MNNFFHTTFKKQNPYKAVLVFVFLFHFEISEAKHYPKDWEKIKNVYASMNNFSMEVEYAFYSSHSAVLSKERMKIMLQKKENSYYMKSPDTETLVNDKYIIIVDHESKILMIDKYIKNKHENTKDSNQFQLDSLLSGLINQVMTKDTGIFTIEEKKINAQEKQCSVHFPHGEYTTLNFVYDPSSFLIKRIQFYYRNPMKTEDVDLATAPRMEIVYRSLNAHPDFSKTTFSEKRFAEVKEGGKLLLTPAVREYNVINHLY